MYKLIEVVPLGQSKLFLKYSNGIKGEYDLSNLIRREEYKILQNNELFKKVFIDKRTNNIVWSCGVILCKNAVYRQLELTNLMKNLRIDLSRV